MKYIQRFLLTILFFSLVTAELFAQIPQVPAEMEFADLLVRINPQARREIQLDVDAQYRSQKHFQVKLDRVNLYMPIIERVLRENNAPEDLKYLVIQESSLISDAVSTSNAVGFWQFKQGTAEEVFLRVDRQIDERKNINASTKGAALYLKKHNNYFDNWMCALVSYQMGLGGAKKYFGDKYNGQRVVNVDRNTHWYFKKFLAHKVAFESGIGQFVSNRRLVEVKVNGPTTLAALAKKYNVTEDHLEEYNTWTSNGKIPSGKTYTLVYISEGQLETQPAIIRSEPKKTEPKNYPKYSVADSYPRVTGNTGKASEVNQIKVNDIKAVQAKSTTTQATFTDKLGIREKKFRRLNDLEKGERIEAGEYYYTKKKKTKAEVETHIVRPGETLWDISQKYGIKLSSLKNKNRIRKDKDLKVGMVLNLQEHRKRGEEIPIVKIDPDPVRNRTVVAETRATPEPEVVAQTPTQPTQTYHTVRQGETLFAISRKYGVSVNELKNWNKIGSDNLISIGQKLVIFAP
ncbi:lytic transglycosylase domain-containing protein [Algoriphagus sediminis]|uniref:LysM peptidoglycan-binding domain-containing protein n=1 Tax=Algoriphagus sediminis TaxID=3057113 RepID=A0ABT7YG33_9BACT|nr:lytic transglycosylase domain-containing protein [Algoriphagus sediminis]MDN3205494.1 LysM peptidoglycan-binding domain-containing protein [Algoriphagus sediminis]